MSQAAAVSRVRGPAVGALSVALSIAAHSYGGGGLPSSTNLALLVIAACVVGAVVAETPWLTRGRLPLLAALVSGQAIGHLVLAASASGHALHHPPIGWQMLLAHAAAAVLCAALIELVERFYGPLTALIRAATTSVPLCAMSRLAPQQSTLHTHGGIVPLDSISRRGPPVCV